MYSVDLKALCRKHGMTLSELARRSSIPQPSLSRYAHGRSDITLRQLSRIALAVGAGPEEILRSHVLTEDFEREIRSRERAGPRQDKKWVTSVLCDLQRHYHGARKWPGTSTRM